MSFITFRDNVNIDVDVDIDVFLSDVFDKITTEDIISELKSRSMSSKDIFDSFKVSIKEFPSEAEKEENRRFMCDMMGMNYTVDREVIINKLLKIF